MKRSRTRFRFEQPAFVPEAMASPIPGYKLLRLRGRGGFATVWEAQGPNGELLALKFMSSHNATATVRELRSLHSIRTIHHPHLLPIYQIWSVSGQIVISMELAEASLLDLMLLYSEEFQRPIELDLLMNYMQQIASAIDFLNKKHHQYEGRQVGYLHADIKLNNILILGEVVKVADYGLATPMTGNSFPCHRHGTIEYVAPEVIAGFGSSTADQFSLAVMYHVLRTQGFPYPAPPPPSQISKNFQRPAPDLSWLEPEERTAVERALSPIPSARFSNCMEFVSALCHATRTRLSPEPKTTLSAY